MAGMDKGAFKTGCQSGGGSFVENPDGSFQCNLKDGGTIKCPDTNSQCSYTAKVSRGVSLLVSLNSAGIKQLFKVSSAIPTKPGSKSRSMTARVAKG